MAAPPASHPAAVTSLDEVEGRANIVLVLGEMATYLCRAGEARSFLEEAAITEDVFGCTASTTSTPSTTKTASCLEAASRLISRLREHVLDRNIIMVFPIHSSQEYREKLLLFMFEKLQVRTIIAMTDLVADTFALGLRESLVLHASFSTLSIGRVEAGVTVEYQACTPGSLSQLVKPTARNGSGGLSVNGTGRNTEGAKNTKNGDISGSTTTTTTRRTAGVDSDGVLLLRSFSPNSVDLLDEAYREALLSLFGDVVYQRVLSIRQRQQGQHDGIRVKRERANVTCEDEEENKAVGKESSGNTVLATTSTHKRRGALGRLISSVADSAPLPVVIVGEALRVAPLLRDFLEETIRVHANSHTGEGDSSSSSSEDSDATIKSSSSRSSNSSNSSGGGSGSNNNGGSSFSSSACACGLLKLQALPLPEFSWTMPLVGGSLVAQLSLAELSKLRISRGDAISSKGSIIHWRSMV